MPILLSIIRADIAVVETYIYIKDLPLDCSITVFGGLQDPGVTYENLKAWQEQTTASFSLQMFSGDHFFINSAQEVLSQKLSQELYLYS